VKEFAGDSHVVFGDVNLQDNHGMPSKFQAGMGGWPTVRYFNAQTGYDGAPYEKKTSKSMCDELGDMEYMRAYVQEKGIPPCNVADLSHCSDQDKSYLEVWRVKSATLQRTELERLQKLQQAKGKPDTLKWIRQRVYLLGQLLASVDTTPDL